MLTDEQATKIFTPIKEKQTFLVLEGKCPHNKGWHLEGNGYNDNVYCCKTCGDTEFC